MLKTVKEIQYMGTIMEDTSTGKCGFINYEDEVLVPFEHDLSTILEMIQNKTIPHIPTTGEIILNSNNGQDIDEYRVEVAELIIEAIGIKRYKSDGRYSEQLGLEEEYYSKVVSAIYDLIGETLAQGDTMLLLYDYGNRNSEYEAFRKRLAELTGIPADYFTSSLEKTIAEKKYFSKNDISQEILDLQIRKPALFIGAEKSYYQTDIARDDSHIKTVTKNNKQL